MKIHDISMPIHPDMPVWKGRAERRPVFTITRDYHGGQGGRETRLDLDLHTGTHIDSPLHFVEGGATIDTIGLTQLVRPIRVLDLTACSDRITELDLEDKEIVSDDFLLLKTRNSAVEGFDLGFVFLDSTGAQYLVDRGVTGVGIDAIGIERSQPNHETHIGLLRRRIVIIEGLRLAHVEPGPYLMVAAPLKIVGTEAAPARVLLIEE